MLVSNVGSQPIEPMIGKAPSHADRRHERAGGVPHPQQALLSDLAEEVSVLVSQTRHRRFDSDYDARAGSGSEPGSLEDALSDAQEAQEEVSMGRRARTPQEEEAERAEFHDDRIRRQLDAEKNEPYYDLLPDTASPEAKAALDVLAGELSDHLHELANAGKPDDVVSFLARRLPEVLPALAGGGGEPDPPVLYASLLYIEGKLRRELGVDGRKQRAEGDVALNCIRSAIEAMLLRHQSELRIGLIIADATYQFFAESLGSAIQARSMYRKEVLQHSGILKTFSNIVDKFGVSRFGAAISFLQDASADDLDSCLTAADKERLKVVRDDLYELATLNTVMRQGDGMVERTRRRHKDAFDESASITHIMKFTLKLAENPLAELASSVSSFSRRCVPNNVFVQCAFLQMLRSIALMMPDKIFEQEAERRGYDTRGMNPKEHVIEMFDEAMEEAFEQEQLLTDFDDEEEGVLMGAAG